MRYTKTNKKVCSYSRKTALKKNDSEWVQMLEQSLQISYYKNVARIKRKDVRRIQGKYDDND